MPAEIEAAKQAEQDEKANELRQELVRINDLLTKDVGAFGKPRSTDPASPEELARKRVGKAMSEAWEKFHLKMPKLAQYLDATVQTVWGMASWRYKERAHTSPIGTSARRSTATSDSGIFFSLGPLISHKTPRDKTVLSRGVFFLPRSQV